MHMDKKSLVSFVARASSPVLETVPNGGWTHKWHYLNWVDTDVFVIFWQHIKNYGFWKVAFSATKDRLNIADSVYMRACASVCQFFHYPSSVILRPSLFSIVFFSVVLATPLRYYIDISVAVLWENKSISSGSLRCSLQECNIYLLFVFD